MTRPADLRLDRILVALDGSELAERVLPYVSQISGRAGGEIVLLTAIQPVGIWDATASAINWEQEEKSAQDYLDAVRQRLTAEGFRVRTRREHGDPAGAVLRAAAEEETGLIAMTTHGRSGIGRWLFGSVTDRCVQSATMPLLLVRISEHEPAPVDLQKILVPLDGSEVASSVLPVVEGFARLFEASLVLYHAVAPLAAYPGFETVYPPITGDALEEMQKQARDILSRAARDIQSHGLATTIAVSIDSAADGILNAAASIGAGLIAIGTHGRSGLGRVVMGSVANDVVRRAGPPCLLLHPS